MKVTREEDNGADTTARLVALRKLMRLQGLDIYIIPSEDAHLSEYTAECDHRRAFISGFTGSAGWAVITNDQAALFTDGRYHLQAEQQLDDNWTLMKVGLPDVPQWNEWVIKQGKRKTVGLCGSLVSATSVRKLSSALAEEDGRLITQRESLIDDIWGRQPARPRNPIIALGLEFTGKRVHEKITDLRRTLKERDFSGIVVCALDEIAWLFNLRGSDIPYNPLFFSFALITETEVTLFVDKQQLSAEAKAHLDGVGIRPYDAIFDSSERFAASATSDRKILVPSSASHAIYFSLGAQKRAKITRSPITDAKAIKNEVEVAGMKACFLRESSALIEFYVWLEEKVRNGALVDEVDAADKIELIRSKKEHYMGLNSPQISCVGPNAALPHYAPKKGTARMLDLKNVYLCDLGGQYKDGTTDTTRTFHFGTPSAAERRAYTLVLKGHISLAGAVFPRGTTGMNIDSFARQHLWKDGLDYRHGTGHGLGSFLSVHEGPFGIGNKVELNEVPLTVGHILTNEPGYYDDGAFGVRIESGMAVKEVETKNRFGGQPYLGFEIITMIPMASSLIEESLLDPNEINWLNNHHAKVLETMEGLFKGNEMALKWLKRECAAR